MRKSLRLCSVLCMLAMLGGAAPQSVGAQADQRCFPETGYCMSGGIRQFWERHGGLPVFGYPITEQHEESIEGQPFQVQWFERNRLELHPELDPPYDVLLGRLGVDRLIQQDRDPNAFQPADPMEGCRFFPETRHNLCGELLAYWEAHGIELDGRPGTSYAESLALFGFPLGEAQTEEIQGNPYTVQWFERARFELHPEFNPPYSVLLGLLGSEMRGKDPDEDLPDIMFTPDDIGRLGEVLARYHLKPEDVNFAGAVAYALPAVALPQPDESGLIVLAAPMRLPDNSSGAIGVLKTTRRLPVNGQVLAPDVYLTLRDADGVRFVSSDGQSAPVLRSVERTMSRNVLVPETIITNKDVCYTSLNRQLCALAAPLNALTSEEIQTLRRIAVVGVRELAAQGLVNPNELNIDGVLPDIAGDAAVKREQASLLAIPTRALPAIDDQGRLFVGVLVVVQRIENPGLPTVPEGSYRAQVLRTGPNEFIGELVGTDGSVISGSVVNLEVRGTATGSQEEPLAIVVDLALGVCWALLGEECKARSAR